MKTCKKCNEEQPLENFSKGYECKLCEAKRKKEWYEKNKERLIEEAKTKYDNNKEYYKNKTKEYRINNQLKVIELNKNYYEKNKERITERNTNWYLNNKDKMSEYKKIWYSNNLDKVKGNKKKWNLKNRVLNNQKLIERQKNNPIFAITCKLRKAILKIFKERSYQKNNKTVEILGCSFEEFKNYLESKFEPWMNWDNRGLYNGTEKFGWDVDHIIPLATANSIEDIIKLNHYTNLQPLCSYHNRVIKRDNVV
jgi:hypothetical protein